MENVLQMCRLCLKNSPKDTVDLFSEVQGHCYAEQILDMLSIELEDTSNWPRSACSDCINFLEQMKKTQQKCLSNHKVLFGLIIERSWKIFNVTKKCRLCLSSSSEGFENLFQNEQGINYARKILETLSVEIEDTPQWPSNACLECIEFLELIPIFQNQILTNHKALFTEVNNRKVTEPAVVKESSPTRMCLEFVMEDDDRIGTESEAVIIQQEDCPESSITIKKKECPGPKNSIEEKECPVPNNSTINKECSETILSTDILEIPEEWFEDIIEFSDEEMGIVGDLIEVDKDVEEVIEATQDEPIQTPPPKTNPQTVPLLIIEEEKTVTPSDANNSDPPITLPDKKAEENSKQPSRQLSLAQMRLSPNEEESKLEALMVEMKIFVCRVCGEDKGTFFYLRDHVKSAHDINDYDVCCDQSLRICTSMLYDHFRWHLDKDAFKCKECGKSFKRKSHLDQHNQRMHSKKTPTHVCQVCGKWFWKRSTHQHHLESHAKAGHTCKYCGKALSSKTSLINHIKTLHTLEVRHLCDLCGRGFYSLSSLTSHINDHAGPHGGNRKKKPKNGMTRCPDD